MNTNDIVLNASGDVAFLPSAKAVVYMMGMPSLSVSKAGLGSMPTEPTIRQNLTAGDGLITYWGDGNDFPQQIIQLAQKNTIIPQALADKAALWIGGGILATADEDAETMVPDAEIRAFLTDITTKRYLLEAMLDMAWWINGFPEFILSKDRSKIVQLHNNEAAYCRWARMNEATGELEYVYINANWPAASATDRETIKVRAINPYRWDRVDWVRNGKDFKYIYPISFPSPGKSYYQLAAWDAARSSGWLAYLAAIPEFKLNAMYNQMTIRYHIEVPEEYWSKVFQEKWTSADFNGKMAIRDQFLADLIDSLTGQKNANKGIMTDKWKDRSGNDMGIVFNVLDDKHKDGKYNEDYSDGLANLLYALGTDPSLFGFQSKDMQRSGGSDKREAFWIFLSKSKPFRDRVLEPLSFIAEYNGWKARYPNLCFKLRDTLLTTLDTGKSTTQTNTPT